ncbi:MAG: penicillin acylase family protein [Acidobacteria bacterium]|nr:penicillin acylase family protein [Acidobacteriota bacterium]
MKRVLKSLAVVLVLLVLVGVGASAWVYHEVRRSLPLLEGEVDVEGLAAPVTVERDKGGVPTVRGEHRLDVARALGFLHAQDRFFQMDLLRRRAAGELAELFGAALVEVDRASRLHLFRARARRMVEISGAGSRGMLEAYAEGVNTGLAGLGQKPFEYMVLGLDPVPWRPEDSALVVLAMFLNLNDETGSRESARGLLRELLPQELAEFLDPPGTEWDAPVVGEIYGAPAIPGPEVFDLRSQGRGRAADAREPGPRQGAFLTGSNSWAVSPDRTAHGHAILADDMHLGISVPNTWYRARLQWVADDGSRPDITGVTLPGAPAIVVGSNGHVAWGFTNTGGDWVDLIVVETDPGDPSRYLTPEGYRSFERTVETIAVHGEEPRPYEITSTIWGPVIDHDHRGRPRALRWIAHLEDGVNMHFVGMERARTLEEAQRVANRSGIPPQNFVCVDADGNIGWTVMGKIPRRIGYDGSVPTSWADGSRRWEGWLAPEEYPRIVNPDTGAIWTANARVVDGEGAATIGTSDYDLGARQGQIRDALLKLHGADEEDMLAVQLDDRALFLERWRRLVLDLLDDEAIEGHPRRARFKDLVASSWTGRASIDSVGYRLVRAYRGFTFEAVYGWLTALCREADERFRIDSLGQWEGPLWRLVTERPVHLLDPEFGSWTEALLAVVDRTIEDLEGDESASLGDRTWGERNTTRIRHPLSPALPALSRWLDMPSQPLPGDSNMPRVQGPSTGASERLAVSPGREERGYFHMPGGQSGHPLSPYYRLGHDAWAEGRPTPFLPGPPEKTLRLVPRR